MKLFFAPVFLFLFSVFCATSCSSRSAPERRIEKYPGLYGQLSSEHRDLVYRGEVAEGMSQDAVFLAWGRPDIVRSGSREGRASELWAYVENAPAPRSTINVGVGTGYSPFYGRFGVHPRFGYATGVGWDIGTGADFVNKVVRTVEFSNGRVVAWERHY